MSDTAPNPPAPKPKLGKWQIPAFLVALVVLVVVVTSIKPAAKKIPLAEHFAQINQMIDSKVFGPAIIRAEELLTWPEVGEEERTELKLLIARAFSGRVDRTLDASKAAARDVLGKYQEAIDAGAALNTRDFGRMAQACERLDQLIAAYKNYEQALAIAQEPELDYRKRLIELSEYPLKQPVDEIDALLAKFMDDAEHSPQHLLWALSRRVEILSQEGRADEALTILDVHRQDFADTPQEHQFDYLSCLTLWHQKQYDEAERRLRELMNRIGATDPVYSRAGWLLGRVVLFDGRAQRPSEALAIFRDVIAGRADRPYVTASRVGAAEALAALLRFDDSLNAYREAIKDLASQPPTPLVNPDAIRMSLTVVSDRLQQDRDFAGALDFARLAAQLVGKGDDQLRTEYLQRIAQLLASRARQVEEEAQQAAAADDPAAPQLARQTRRLFEQAAEAFSEVSQAATLNEELSAKAVWTAANLFEEAHRFDRTIDLLKAFVVERPESPATARVLLRLGRCQQQVGQFQDAIDTFQQNYARFPRSPHANAGLLPLAQCFMALGPERFEEARQALFEIVGDSDIYTPQAPEYRDAMFLLGELYTLSGEQEKAIPVLQEAVANYGADERAPRAMFLHADAYRASAEAIREDLLDPKFIGERKRLKAERIQRLETAAELYEGLIARLETRPAENRDVVDNAMLRDARLYEAACLFSLQQYEDALARYERAAWVYKDSPAALGAYVQVINCYEALGRMADADAALRRAQYLVDQISDEAYATPGERQTREDWRSYFAWLARVREEEKGQQVAAQAGS